MQQCASQYNVFANFNLRKKPTITYKRKSRFNTPGPLEEIDDTPNESIAPFEDWNQAGPVDSDNNAKQSFVNDSSTHTLQDFPSGNHDSEAESVFDYPKSSVKHMATPIFQEEKGSDVFDFPDTDLGSTEVELMVASTALKAQQGDMPRKAKPRRKSKAHQDILMSQSTSFPTPTKRVQTMERCHSDSIIISSHISQQNRIKDVPAPMYSECSSFNIAPVLDTHPCVSRNAPNTQTPQKRKLRLVSRLKSANGEFTPVNSRSRIHEYDSLDTDEEEELMLYDESSLKPNDFDADSPCNIFTAESLEITYEERMERELASIMHTEFGEDNDKLFSQSKSKAGPINCEPENSSHVRVTYQRSEHRAEEDTSLDNMNQKLHELLSELCGST